MTLSEWAHEIHIWAIGKGWWESSQRHTIVGKLLFVHSEVSEAAEELRDLPMGNGRSRMTQFDIDFTAPGVRTLMYDSPDNKPVGFASEIADTIIRCLDICARIGIDIDDVIEQKMAYNQKRPYQHGGRTF